jgi:hypothetical protein
LFVGGSTVAGSLPFHTLTPMEIIEREMGKTGLVHPGIFIAISLSNYVSFFKTMVEI